MIRNLAKLILRPAYKRYDQLIERVTRLETIVEAMISSPKWIESDEVGFNGQRIRKKIFHDILRITNFDLIIETGTGMGDTTGYMARSSGLFVYSCELNKIHYAISKSRLQDIPNIDISLIDSRPFLSKITNTDISRKRLFFYLDAHLDSTWHTRWNASWDTHWYNDLPLVEELGIICKGCNELIIMIDDFQVPGDSGYGFADYGKERAISLEILQETIAKYQLIPFFPASPSSEETGAKRGCVILTKVGIISDLLVGLESLRTYPQI